MKHKLSVCIIAKNEEKMLGDCIDSLSSCADEIIVVDTGSSDNTVNIAKNKGAKVFFFEWNDSFADARNYALSQANGDFILSIDADERLLNPESLINTLDNSIDIIGGWLVEVVSNVSISQNSMHSYSSNLLRLFRNSSDIRYEGIIHEQVLNSIARKKLKVINSPVKFSHLGYDISPEQMKKKELRNLNLLNKYIDSNPNDIYHLVQRAKTYQALGDLLQAEKDFVLALSLGNPQDPMRTRALNYGALNAYRLNNFPLAESRAFESLQIIEVQEFANFIIAEMHFDQKRFPLAYEHYKKMLFARENPSIEMRVAGDYLIPLEQLYYKLGRSLLFMDEIEKAGEFYRSGFMANPKDVNCLVGLAHIAYKIKNYSSARQLLESAKKIAPHFEEIDKFIYQVDIEERGIQSVANNTIQNSDTKSLSVSMIVKNEEKFLPDCLESIKDIADEIIIVDTGSYDSTIEIAKKHGAKVYSYEWNDDFAAARNEALKYSSSDWILYLDADERLSDESRQNIKKYISLAAEDIGALICIIESNHIQLDGSRELHRGGYPRLFRNYGYPNIKFQGRVHEQISPSIVDLKKTLAISDITIIHLGYNRTREEMEKKIKRNYQLLLQHVNEEPLNGYAWYQLGQTLGQMRLKKESEDAIRFAIKCGNLSDSIYASASATLAQLCGNNKNFQESLHWADESLKKAPDSIYSQNLKAFSLMYLGKPELAKPIFISVLDQMKTKRNIPLSGFDIELSEDLVMNGLKKALQMLGEI